MFGSRIQRLGNKLELTDTQKYQLNFLKKNGVNNEFGLFVGELDILHSTKTIDKNEYHHRLKEWIYSNVKLPVVLNIGCEIIIKDFFVEVVQSILRTFPIECYVSVGTSNQYEYFLNPLVQVYNWKECAHHRNFEDDLFTPIYFQNINKSNRGILTMNRSTPVRDYLDKSIETFDGYYNYSANTNEFLDWKVHSELSKKSFVHFVVETDCYDLTVKNINLYENHLTEKTILPILEESIIVVLGGYDYVNSLESLGIKTWNSYFNFETKREVDYKSRVNSFVKCINTFNEMGYMEIENLYKDNIDSIKNNKSLITQIIYS